MLLFLSIYSRNRTLASVYMRNCAPTGYECLHDPECICWNKTSKRDRNVQNAIQRYQKTSVWRPFSFQPSRTAKTKMEKTSQIFGFLDLYMCTHIYINQNKRFQSFTLFRPIVLPLNRIENLYFSSPQTKGRITRIKPLVLLYLQIC